MGWAVGASGDLPDGMDVDVIDHEQTAESMLERLSALRNLPPEVLAQCATAHAMLALVDAVTPSDMAPPADTSWLDMERAT